MQKYHQHMWFHFGAALAFGLKAVLGLVLIFTLPPVSMDDYFRMFHATWWWNHVSFTSSFIWLPGHQYVYGTLYGVFHDTDMVPKIFTLILQLCTGWFFFRMKWISAGARLLGLIWLFFSPVSMVLGAAALSENVAYFFLALHLFFITQATERVTPLRLLLSSLFLLCAFVVRYEVWVLWVVYFWWGRTHRSAELSTAVHFGLIALPLIFPLAWILHGSANPEGTWSFLFSTVDDHHGSGSLLDTVQTAVGAVTLIQIFVVVVALIVSFRRRTILHWYGWTLGAAILMLVLFHALPSQFTVRIFYGLIFLGAGIVTDMVQFTSKRRIRFASLTAVVFVIAGFVTARTVPLGISDENFELARWVKSQYETGAMSSTDMVVVSHYLPDCTSVGVLSNHTESVHIDTMSKGCVWQFLSEYAPPCRLPDWSKNVRMLVVWRDSSEKEYADTLKWPKIYQNASWVVYLRPEGASFPIENKPVHPFLLPGEAHD